MLTTSSKTAKNLKSLGKANQDLQSYLGEETSKYSQRLDLRKI
jgi:hypothetical protein